MAQAKPEERIFKENKLHLNWHWKRKEIYMKVNIFLLLSLCILIGRCDFVFHCTLYWSHWRIDRIIAFEIYWACLPISCTVTRNFDVFASICLETITLGAVVNINTLIFRLSTNVSILTSTLLFTCYGFFVSSEASLLRTEHSRLTIRNRTLVVFFAAIKFVMCRTRSTQACHDKCWLFKLHCLTGSLKIQ